MDGWVTIGTDLDSRKFDKEMKKLEKQSEKFAKEEERLLNKKAKLELDTSKTMNELEIIDSKIELINKKMQSIAANNTAKNLESNINYQKLIIEAQQLNAKGKEYDEKLQLQKTNLNEINRKLKANAENQALVKAKLEETEARSLGLHMNFDNIGKSIMSNVRKVGKWVMAVFSVRSAYMTVRNAMSVISTYNDDLNNKLYSIKMIFATALEPIITRIVNLAWKLMSYINYIAKAWFGVDLASKASANSMKAGAKAAKEMRKSLMGFDEANVLNDNGTTGAAGASTPKFEMPENVEIPSWVKWIAEHKDEVLGFLKQLGILIAALKLAKLFGLIGNIGKITKTLFGLLKGMSGLQIFALIAGVVITLTGIITTIKGIISFIKDPSWSNLNKILEGLTLTLLGVGLAMVALNASNPVGWVVIAIGLVAGLVTGLSELARGFFENKANIKSVEQAQKDLIKAQEDLKKATEDLTNATDNYDNVLKNAEEASKKLEEAEKKNKISGKELFDQVLDGKIKYQDMTEAQKEVYKAYTNNMDAQEKLKDSTKKLEESTENYKEAKEAETKASWENQLAIAKESGNYDNFKKTVVEAYEKGELKAEEARTLIERSMAGMSDASKRTFTQDLPNDIKQGLDPNRYESNFNNFKRGFKGLIDGIGDYFKTLKRAFSDVWEWITGKARNGVYVPVEVGASNVNYGSIKRRGNAKGAIVYPKLQYHASGGIINQPGRGVPITQHIGGERGPEGVLPLTDSQQMDLLGQAIARYMTINLTNINQMNGRVISRELKRIEAQHDFAINS